MISDYFIVNVLIIGALVVAFVLLYLRAGDRQSFTEKKRAEVERKRAALAAKRQSENSE